MSSSGFLNFLRTDITVGDATRVEEEAMEFQDSMDVRCCSCPGIRLDVVSGELAWIYQVAGFFCCFYTSSDESERRVIEMLGKFWI